MTDRGNAPTPPPGLRGVQQMPQPQPEPPGNGGKSKMSSGAKIAIGVSAGVIVFLVASFLALASFMRSCSAWLGGTEETHDTREVAAFINDPTVTKRDLEIFDILRPGFEQMHIDSASSAFEEKQLASSDVHRSEDEARRYVDAFRATLEAGSWPADDPTFGTPEYSASPQLWVRVAELAQDHIEKETGEQWRVLALSYPSRIIEWDYVIPIAEAHGANDALITSLECVSGPNAGMTVDVGYYRWANPAYFASKYEERSAVLQGRRDQEARLQESGLLDGRRYALDGVYHSIYVWSTGEDDPLRDFDTFTQTLNDLAEATGMEGLELTLLKGDAPAFRNRLFRTAYSFGGDFAVVPVPDAPKAILMDVCEADSFTFAPADVLLQQMIDSDGEVGGLRGSLVPAEDDPLYDWRSTYQVEADDVFSALVAWKLGLPEDQVIALYGVDNSGSHVINVVVPRGALEETPDAAEESIRALQLTLWQTIFAVSVTEDLHSLHLVLYVIDEEDLTRPDGAASFADLHAAVLADTQAISSFDAPYVLRASLSSYAYDREVENVAGGWVTDYGVDLEGPVTESRAWYLATAEEY